MPHGMMRFLVPPSRKIPRLAVERAFLAGFDQVPWSCQSRFENGELSIERSVSDSGKLYIPWLTPGHGELVLCTGTLMERPKPYVLAVELARGKINQLRNQAAEWQAVGMMVSPRVIAGLRTAVERFALAATSQADIVIATSHAESAIVAAVEAADTLVAEYVDQCLAVRHRQTAKLPDWLGVNLGQAVPDGPLATRLRSGFNSAVAPMNWRHVEANEGHYDWTVSDAQVESLRRMGMKVVGGPLLRLDEGGLPDWLFLWENDFDNLLSFVSDYVETTVQRYKGKVRVWQAAARFNVHPTLALDEEQRLQLVARTIEIARRVDPDAETIIRFDQPWADYMGHLTCDLSPLHFADALVRSGLQLSGVGLELNLGYYPAGASPRDRIDFSRLLDLWSYLGTPLHVFVTTPSSETETTPSRGKSKPILGASPGGATPSSQAQWAKRFLPLFLSKPAVHSIFWNQLSDADPREYSHAGLLDAGGNPKPILAEFASLRAAHLE